MTFKKIEITTEFIRLDSFLKFAGITQTGGQAKMIIEDQLVKVDGEICTQRGKKLYNGTKVEFVETNLGFEVVKIED